jgi:hypothetical protein
MKKKLLIFIFLIAAIFLSSCTIVKFQTTDSKLMYQPNTRPYYIVGSFDIRITEVSIIAKLFKLNQPGLYLEEIFIDQIRRFNGDAVINIQLEYHYTALQIFFIYLTGAIFTPTSISVRGDVIKYK